MKLDAKWLIKSMDDVTVCNSVPDCTTTLLNYVPPVGHLLVGYNPSMQKVIPDTRCAYIEDAWQTQMPRHAFGVSKIFPLVECCRIIRMRTAKANRRSDARLVERVMQVEKPSSVIRKAVGSPSPE
jgi:hypothetical protein